MPGSWPVLAPPARGRRGQNEVALPDESVKRLPRSPLRRCPQGRQAIARSVRTGWCTAGDLGEVRRTDIGGSQDAFKRVDLLAGCQFLTVEKLSWTGTNARPAWGLQLTDRQEAQSTASDRDALIPWPGAVASDIDHMLRPEYRASAIAAGGHIPARFASWSCPSPAGSAPRRQCR
jgi:hypothetical protein